MINKLSDQLRLHSLYLRLLKSWVWTLSVLSFIFVYPHNVSASEDPVFEEVSVHLNVQGVGGQEVPAVISGEVVYLSVADLFEYLKILNKSSNGLNMISGFFINQNAPYLIDKAKSHIVFQNKTFPLNSSDLILNETGLYLKSDYFGKVFGLNCIFNFRTLSVTLNTKAELPAMREKRQELMRQNVNRLKQVIKADTTIKARTSLFNLGAADWSVISTQHNEGLSNTRLNANFGAVIAGGETTVLLNYESNHKFSERQQYYLWRFVNNKSQALQQIIAGKIPTQSVSSIMAPVVGLQITNAPTTYRKSFGTFTMSDITEPGWTVELYINNVLVDYAKADASGFFTFQVPMVYGNSAIKLRFFGQWGEERTREKTISIPYNFLPAQEMEYTVSAGMLEDGKQSRFSRADLNYGLTQNITLGGGLEYLSSVSSGSSMPFINASLRLNSNVFLSGDYTYGVRGKGMLSYRMPSDLLIELDYTKYKKGQTAINQNYLEERKAAVSFPIRGQNFSAFSRLSWNQIVFPKTNQTTAEFLLSGVFAGVSTNLTTYALLLNSYTSIYSNLSMAFRMPKGFLLRPQMQYGYVTHTVNNLKLELEKQIFGRGFLNFSFENNLNYHTQNLGLTFRYDLSFARASFAARQSNSRTTFTQSIRGGTVLDAATKYFSLNNRTNTGKGGLTIYPYLDINSNNHHDKNEPRLGGLKLKINGGRIQNNESDTTIRVFGLEPYKSYLLELSKNSFDNIAWQIKKSTLKVEIEPNKLKRIEVPVSVVGEASGMVYKNDSISSGQGRIIINFYRSDSSLAGQTVTERDGFFSFLGLTPGMYTARIDTTQLCKLNLTVSPSSLPININPIAEGDVVNGLQFVLHPLDNAAADGINLDDLSTLAENDPHNQSVTNTSETAVKPKSIIPVAQVSTEENINKDLDNSLKAKKSNNLSQKETQLLTEISQHIDKAKDSEKIPVKVGFAIEIGVLGDENKALDMQSRFTTLLRQSPSVFFTGTSYFKMRFTGFATRQVAETFIGKLTAYGYTGAYIIPYKLQIVKVKDKNGLETRKVIPQLAAIEKEAVNDQITPINSNNSLPSSFNVKYGVTAGRFTSKTDALALQKQVLTVLKRSVSIVFDNEYYKIRIIGFETDSDAEKLRQELIGQELKGVYVFSYHEKNVVLKDEN